MIGSILKMISPGCAVTIHLMKTIDGKGSIVFIPVIKTENEEKLKFTPIIISDDLESIDLTFIEKTKATLGLLSSTAAQILEFEKTLNPTVGIVDIKKEIPKKPGRTNVTPEEDKSATNKQTKKPVDKKVVKEETTVTVVKLQEGQEHCIACGGTMNNSKGKCSICKGTGIKQEETVTKTEESGTEPIAIDMITVDQRIEKMHELNLIWDEKEQAFMNGKIGITMVHIKTMSMTMFENLIFGVKTQLTAKKQTENLDNHKTKKQEVVDAFEGNKDGAFEGNTDKVGVDSKVPPPDVKAKEQANGLAEDNVNQGETPDDDDWFK